MASRAVVPENPQGGKPKNAQPDGRNRRVLRDIGNLVLPQRINEEKPQNDVARPATRSFGVQLLANAQAAAEKNNCKVQKPAVVKPKDDDELIEISSDEKESVQDKKVIIISPNTIQKTGKRSSKKPGKSLTATLTARSKAACELNNKPKYPTVDIDAADVGNELAAVEYIEDMYSYYKLTEEDGRVFDYMGLQPEINSKMRSILVDWLIEVHRKFELLPESLYLTINIMDRFLSTTQVPRRELQLVGISAMLIACKYEEIWAPEVSDFIAISDNAYVREQVLLMEKAILGKLEWYLTVPTAYVFLVRYIKASSPADEEMENMTFFYAELGLTNYSMIVNYSPSKMSAGAVYAARCTLKRSPLWTETLKHHTGYSEDELMECARKLVGFHAELATSKLRAGLKKYSNPERGGVALFPPARNLLLAA